MRSEKLSKMKIVLKSIFVPLLIAPLFLLYSIITIPISIYMYRNEERVVDYHLGQIDTKFYVLDKEADVKVKYYFNLTDTTTKEISFVTYNSNCEGDVVPFEYSDTTFIEDISVYNIVGILIINFFLGLLYFND